MDAFDVPDDIQAEEDEVEYEEEDDVDLPDDEIDDPDIEYLDEETIEGADIMPEDLDEEDSDPDAETARLLAYFGKDEDTED